MPTPPAAPAFHVVIPAGGVGSRLWPLSRADHPKFLLDLDGGGRSMLQATWDRLAPLAPVDRRWVVTGDAHVGSVRGQLSELGAERLLSEPSPRNSAAAIGLAAAVLHRRDPAAVLGAFPADHVVRDAGAWVAGVRQARVLAARGSLVTLGIEPTYPATGFGYVEGGAPVDVEGAPDGVAALSFVEKPDAARAAEFVARGTFRWNAGVFVVAAAVLVDLIARYRPDLAVGLAEIADAWDGPDRDDVLARVWPTLPSVAIDHAVAEPAAADGLVAMVPVDPGWDDVGSFASLAALLGSSGDGPAVLGDQADVLSHDSTGLVVAAGGRPITVLGMTDVVVVDTPDGLLVTDTAHAERVRELVAEAAARGWPV